MKGTETCFHCALPVPPGCNITVDIEGEQRPVCCPGCKAVATLIRDAGLTRYYDSRDRPDPGQAHALGHLELRDVEIHHYRRGHADRDGCRGAAAEAVVDRVGKAVCQCFRTIMHIFNRTIGINGRNVTVGPVIRTKIDEEAHRLAPYLASQAQQKE